MFPPRIRLLAVELSFAALTLIGAFAVGGLPAAQAQATDAVLSVLKNTTYPSEYTPSKQAPLRDGKYEFNQPPLRASVTFVDAAIGAQRTAVLLASSTGGSGVFLSLHLVTSQNGAIIAGPGLFLGDRQRVEAFTISGDRARVDLVTQGPNEPQCCPTQHETREFVVDGNVFRTVSIAVTQPGGTLAPVAPKTGNLGRISEVGALPPVLALFTLAFALLARAASQRGVTKP